MEATGEGIRITRRGMPTRDGPAAWEMGEGLSTPHSKRTTCYEMSHRASDMDASDSG
jgi:hypothetical protein